MSCPVTSEYGSILRPELENLPERMKWLPVHRGYPVPWFVPFLKDGTPEFRAMSPAKWRLAHNENLCWVCGAQRHRFMSFVLGPMCTITRTNAEPPSHLKCAEWSARNCPFVSRPHMVHRDGDALVEQIQQNVARVAIKRNPEVAAVWTTTRYSVFLDEKRRPLIRVGAPISVTWWSEGRPATRAEVEHSVNTGFPIVEATIALDLPSQQENARRELYANREKAKAFWPLPWAGTETPIPARDYRRR